MSLWNLQDDDPDLANILGRYSWIWKEETLFGTGLFKVNEGSLTLELRDPESPATPQNITGKLYFGTIEASINFFELPTGRGHNEPENHWMCHLDVVDRPDCYQVEELEYMNGQHNVSVLKELDDCGRPFLLVELSLGHEGCVETFLLLLAKRWNEGESWKPSRSELELFKDIITGDYVDDDDDAEADEGVSKTVDGAAVVAKEESMEFSK